MNYLAHGWRYASDPYFLAGTAAPDWMNVINRKVRLRSRAAAEFIADADPVLAAFARGVVQHHADDHWFHATSAFAALSLDFAVQIRDVLPGDEGFRPRFLGHILVELLLDASLAAEDPARLEAYYAALAQIDPAAVERAVLRLASLPSAPHSIEPGRVATLIPRFIAERFLYDYEDDARLLMRLNHIMRRVNLPALPASFQELLPALRVRVENEKAALLSAGE